MATEAKKLALLRIAEILERETDRDHPLTHNELADMLLAAHGIEIERKAVGRNIALLCEAGYPITTTKRGVYLERRTYTPEETRLLLEAVLADRRLTAAQARDLLTRLCAEQNKFFSAPIHHILPLAEPSDPEADARVSALLAAISEAIDKGRMVEYDYNKYGADKALRKTSFQRVTPYRLLLHNRRYYLMGYNKYWKSTVYHRLDRITNLSVSTRAGVPAPQNAGAEADWPPHALTTAMPYLYTDAPERIELLTQERHVDRIMDRFGRDIHIERADNTGLLRIALSASPKAMLPWALQYADEVEILRPAPLRDKIKETLRRAAAKYDR